MVMKYLMIAFENANLSELPFVKWQSTPPFSPDECGLVGKLNRRLFSLTSCYQQIFKLEEYARFQLEINRNDCHRQLEPSKLLNPNFKYRLPRRTKTCWLTVD
jgi:hypothetical protein